MLTHTPSTWRRLFPAMTQARARQHRAGLDLETLENRRVPAVLAPLTLAPADYNGDGRSEFAVFQPQTSTFYINSLEGTNGNRAIQFGQGTLYGGNPIPVVADFNHDGTAELAVFQPSTSTFYIRHLYADTEVGNRAIQFGQGTLYGGNPEPVVADYNGDGRAELAVFQPGTSTFSIRHLTSDTESGNQAIQFGQGIKDQGNPIPVVADYNDDGKAEIAVYQPGTSTFFIQHLMSETESGNRAIPLSFGPTVAGHPPRVGQLVPAVSDLNGDGKVELIVYDPSSSEYRIADLEGDRALAARTEQFGQGTLYGGNPVPVCADFDGDGHCELTVYQPRTSTFYVHDLKVKGVPTNSAIQFGQGTLYGGRPVALPWVVTA